VRVRRRHGEKLLYRLGLQRYTTQMLLGDGRLVRLNRWLRRLVFRWPRRAINATLAGKSGLRGSNSLKGVFQFVMT
jgi:hypothetical protein